MIIMKIVSLLIIAALLCVAVLLELAENKSRKVRYKQRFIPVAAVVYSVVASAMLWFYSDKVIQLLPESEYSVNMEIFLINILVIAGFLVLKGVILLFIREKIDVSTADQDQGDFYYPDTDYDQFFLRTRWEIFRKVFSSGIILYTLLCLIFFCLTNIYGDGSVFWMRITPITVLMFVIEVYNYLKGYTREEYQYLVGGDASYSQKISAFFKLRGILEALFPNNLLEARTGDDYKNSKATFDYIRDLAANGDDIDSKTAEFFSSNEGNERYDVDYIRAMQKIMQKENVVFLNPFYRDLTKYIILPLIHALISDEKVLIILGRNSSKSDVQNWIEEMLKDYAKVDSLWYVAELKKHVTDCDVGILCFNELYDIRNLENNRSFFDNTGLVLILEPSLVINTGQIGFSILADQMKESGLSPVYCIIDRMVEGLIDTMSHLLREKITEVIAPPVPRSVYTDMAWDADGDYMRQNLFQKQTRYFGSGFEIAAVAIKNQIPHVKWISESKSPIRDLKWIVGQHYTSLCKYMNLPIQQSSLYDKIDFIPGLWSVERENDQFVIVDDEFCNLFSMIRMFLSRAENQIFLNVMSENYLLRDYMRCNQQMFSTNPNLIPSIVPDYAKTERNTLFKILYMMSYKPLSERIIRSELKLIHYPDEDVLNSLNKLIKRYSPLSQEGLISVHTQRALDGLSGTETEFFYSISHGAYREYLSKILANAYYIVEKENEETEYIDARFFSQVTQTILPGQFVVYDGKYYIVHHISAEHGVILRRASDLYDRRLYYRQVRKYILKRSEEEKVISRKKIMDVVLEILCADFSVETTGYLEMNSTDDLRTARLVDFTGDEVTREIFRKYKNKNIMRILLPETSKHERFTICMLLMEMFHTVFPNTWQYLACVATRPENIEGMLNYMMYDLDGDIDDNYIYIIEDSDLDLGLIEAIEKNFMRFMEILCDYINWHFEKMREPEYKDPEPENIIIPKVEDDGKKRKGLLKLLERIRKIFGGRKKEDPEPHIEMDDGDSPPEDDTADSGAFTGDEGNNDNAEPEVDGTSDQEYILDEDQDGQEQEAEEDLLPDTEPSEDTEDSETMDSSSSDTEDFSLDTDQSPQEDESDYTMDNDDPVKEDSDEDLPQIPEEEADIFEPEASEDPDIVDIDGTDIFDTVSDIEHEEYFDEYFRALGIDSMRKTRYQKQCYLKFGFDEIDHRIELDSVHKYLNARGWANNTAFSLARERELFMPDAGLYMAMENQCDFCGAPLSGISFERLNDGRIRCNNCSASAITSPDEFRTLFYHTIGFMQNFYNIEFKHSVTVKTVDANTIAKGVNMVFKPSTGFAVRALGYAQKKKDEYSLLIENGSPRLATVATMVHEMTHIWQYVNWKDAEIIAHYGDGSSRDIVYEGMAMWAEIQYLYLIGETAYAMQQEENTKRREDIYGIGFVLYCQKYPLIKDSSLVGNSPFKVFPPL